MSVGPFEEATVAYSNGDYATALRLFESLANQGNIDAQYDLGVMYANGRGLPQDYVQAHMWFNLASTGGDPAAIEGRDSIAKLMSPAEIAEAQKLAHEWKGHPSSGRPSTKSSNH